MEANSHELKRRRVRKRRVKKPKTFKQKLKSLIKKQFGFIVYFLISFFIIGILFGAISLFNYFAVPEGGSILVDTDKEKEKSRKR